MIKVHYELFRFIPKNKLRRDILKINTNFRQNLYLLIDYSEWAHTTVVFGNDYCHTQAKNIFIDFVYYDQIVYFQIWSRNQNTIN